jgi:putative transposase
MIDKKSPLSMSRQCQLLDVHRSGLYYQPRQESEENLAIMRMLDEQYLKTPFYGIPKVTKWLNKKSYKVNHKRVERLMKLMGWQTIYRRKSTSKPDREHPIYPYLLKELIIDRFRKAWAMDITYVPMRKGFMYLCAVIDLYTRLVLSWNISNTMLAGWCSQVAEEAISVYGAPEIFNTDQAGQFTSEIFTELLKRNQIKISMDSVGRALDNIFVERLWRTVKYEHIYLHVAEDGVMLYEGLKKYFLFYNHERIHQSLGYKTPMEFLKMHLPAA